MLNIESSSGIIKAHINTLLSSGQTYTKDEARRQFDIIYQQRLNEISKKIADTIERNDVFNLIFDTYQAFEQRNFPNKASMLNFLGSSSIGAWKSCGFYKSNELIHVNPDLPSVWREFKIINQSDFASFFYQCCFNLFAALEHIGKFQGKLGQKLTNELAQYFKVGPKRGSCFPTTDVDLNDLQMIDQPPNYQLQAEQDKATFLQWASHRLRELFYGIQNKTSRRLYLQEEFATVIIQHIQWRSTVNREWDLIFSQAKFVARVSLLVDDFLNGKMSFDHELIQTLILKIDRVFEDYNDDFKALGLVLSLEAKSLAHKIAFRKLLELFTAKFSSEAYNERDLWEAKRDELLQFFVSQLAPDQAKDEENAKQFMRTFAESIEQTLQDQMRGLIDTQVAAREDEFSRLRLQEKRDATLSSLSREKLLEYVLNPTEFIYNDFMLIWRDFEASLTSEFRIKQNEQLRLFDELKELLHRLNEQMSRLKTAPETFKAQELFRVANTLQLMPESAEQINKSVYFKVCYGQHEN